MPDFGAAPPLPPGGYDAMLGPGAEPETPPSMGPSAGMNQTGQAALRIAMEIDMAMKTLAQMVPALAPWAEQSTSQLRQQLTSAINGGGMPTGPEPSENRSFPGGQGLL
jgi:hypothetical protein